MRVEYVYRLTHWQPLVESKRMDYYINGEQVSKSHAVIYVTNRAMHKGYDEETIKQYLRLASRSEEAREIISGMTDYRLEIIAD